MDKSTMAVSSLTKRGHKNEANDALDILITEREPLIAKSDKTCDLDYSKHGSLEIQTTWRHWLIGPVIFIYMFAMVSSYFTLITYTKEYFRKVEYEKANISIDNTTDDQCDADTDDIVYQTETKATATAATWALYYSLATGVPAVISNMVLGSYTDSFGRKYLLAVGIIGTCLRLGISALVIYFDADITYILIACFVEGCTGQYATALQASFAYVADITKPGRSRMLGIVYVEFFLGIGTVSATIFAGYLIRSQGYMFIFSSMSVVLVVAFVLMLLALPETQTNKHQHRHKSCLALLKISIALFTENDSENRRWKYQVVLLMLLLVNIAFHARLTTETLYQLASPFCWSVTKIGIYAAIRSVAVMFIGLGSIKVFQLFLDEIWICMIGTVSYCAAFLWTAFVKDDVTYYIIIAVGCFGPLSVTMHRSILSHLTPPEKQGAIFSAIGTQEVISQLLSHVIANLVYAETVSYMRGLVFLVMGGIDGICIVLLLVLKMGWYIEKRSNKFQSVSEKKIMVPATDTEQRV